MRNKDTKWFTVYGEFGQIVFCTDDVVKMSLKDAGGATILAVDLKSLDGFMSEYKKALADEFLSKTLESIDACFQTRLWDEHFGS